MALFNLSSAEGNCLEACKWGNHLRIKMRYLFLLSRVYALRFLLSFACAVQAVAGKK